MKLFIAMTALALSLIVTAAVACPYGYHYECSHDWMGRGQSCSCVRN